MTGLLDGIVVIDLSGVGPGSRCSRVLADFGATVVKVRPPLGTGPLEPPAYAYSGGRGFHLVRVNLKDEDGRALVLRMAERADVFLESYRPGTAARLGVGFEDVARINQTIVYCSISGFGQDGPYASWAAHDLNYQALAGVLGTTQRRADGGPAIQGATFADSAGGGFHGALSVLAALVAREHRGEPRHLDVSTTEGVLYLNALHVDSYLGTGHEPTPDTTLTTGKYACYDLYQAGDGGWLAVGAIEEKFFRNLCRELDCKEWIPHQYDDEMQERIRAAFEARFATKDRDEWVAELAPRDTCVSPVYGIAEIPDDPHLEERGAFVTYEHPELGGVRQVGPILAGGAIDRGEDLAEVLQRIGLRDDEAASLIDRSDV